jgi:ELWxxDGT repeat protein
VADIDPGSPSSEPDQLTVVGSTLFFVASQGGDRELWKSDGTAAGTVRVKDIKTTDPFPSWGPPDLSSRPADLVALGSTLFFVADNGTEGRELWKSDGSEVGTTMVKDLRLGVDPWSGGPKSSYPSYLVPWGGRVYFVAGFDDETHEGNVLFSTDGTADGTLVVSTINENWSGYPSALAVAGDRLFFSAQSGLGVQALWTSDGSTDGTAQVAAVGASWDAVRDIVPFGAGVLFTGDDGATGAEPWVSDGTADGTGPLADIAVVGGSSPSRAVVVGGVAYFSAFDETHGRELWRTDGTADGTWLVRDVRPGADSGMPVAISPLAAGVGFAADDGIHGVEPWYSDGTEAGTVLARDVNPEGDGIPMTASGSYAALVRLNGRLLFGADDGDGSQLWASDGTAAGTQRVSAIPLGTRDAFAGEGNGSSASYVARAVLDGFLYFPADDGIHGTELWKSDGTAVGTSLVADLTPGAFGSDISRMVTAGGTLAILTDGGWDELTQTRRPSRVFAISGSPSSATLVAEGSYDDIVDVAGVLYVISRNGQILRSDGTAAGTVVVDDAYGNTQAEQYERWFNNYAVVGDRLFYEKLSLLSVSTPLPGGGWTDISMTVGSVWAVGATGPAAEVATQAAYPDYEHAGEFIPAFGALGFVVQTYNAELDTYDRNLWKVESSGEVAPVSGLQVGYNVGYGGSAMTADGLYFTSPDPEDGSLWLAVSDGTEEGTRYVAALPPSPVDGSIWVQSMTTVPAASGDRVFFVVAATNNFGGGGSADLWVSDGTATGTTAIVTNIEDIEGVVDGRIAYRATRDGVSTLFLADDGAGSPLTIIPPVAAQSGSALGLLGALDNRLVIAASDVSHGRELFAASLADALGTPTAVSATASNGAATVTWTAPASDGGSPVTDYLLERSSDGGATWQSVADGVSTATTANVPGLVNGTTYRFRVAAVNGAGTGAWSDPSAAVTPMGLPGAVTGLSATPSDGRVGLAWAPPASDGGRPVSDYVVESSLDGGKTWKVLADGTSPTATATMTGLVNGTSYLFRVSAVTEVGTGPASAPSAPAIPAKPAGAPTAVKVTRGDARVSLVWKTPASNGGSPVTDYVVQSSIDGGKTWVTAADEVSTRRSAVVSDLINGKSYVFRVAAVNSVGAGTFSAATPPAIPAGLPAVATELAAVRGNASVSLSWKAPASTGGLPISDYVVQSSKDGGATWKTEGDKVSADTKAIVSGLVNGSSYVFRVAAKNAVGFGPSTAASVAVVPATVPTMVLPASVMAKGSDSQATLAWKPPASNGGAAIADYVVQSSADGGKTWATVVDGVSIATSATVSGLVNGKPYVFRVAAVNEVGTGPFTPKTAPIIPAAAPGLPTGLTASRANSKITLSWTAPVSTGGLAITDYTAEWSADGGATWRKMSRAKSPATTATVGGQSKSVSYRFRVAAVNAAGLRGAFAELAWSVGGQS